MPDLALLVQLLQLAVKDRTQLALENIALRHQLTVYKRSANRPIIRDGDRIFSIHGHDADVGDILTITPDSLPPGATLDLVGTNPVEAVFTWDAPTIDDVGQYLINLTVTDDAGAEGTCDLQVTVPNRLPTCELSVDGEYLDDDTGGAHGPDAHHIVVTEGQTVSVTFTASDPDPGDVLTVADVARPTGSTFAALAEGEDTYVLEWTPAYADAEGNPHGIFVVFEDSFGAQTTCHLQVVVNRRPSAIATAAAADGTTTPAPGIEVDCDAFDGRLVTLDASESFDEDGDELSFQWRVAGVELEGADTAVATGGFPIGITMGTVTVFDDRGGMSTADVVVTVVDNMPPEVMVTTDTAALWPPKHDMRDVMLHVVATDNCSDPDQVLALEVSIRSDEPDDSEGDGTHTGDVNGQPAYETAVQLASSLDYDADGDKWIGSVPIQLRAERDGRGNGRTYTIEITVIDTNDNVTTSTCVVVVPHDQGEKKGKKK